MVGGTASVYADVSSSISKDLKLIFPIAAGLILLILIAMLRSVVAPLYLLAAVGLEFAATLGAAVVAFQYAAGQPGVAFTLPLVLFLFVVAIGTDYNLLMSDRLREEFASGVSVRQAVANGVRHAAPPIMAAGLVLATSFGSLMIYDDQETKQTGFGMALGILFASFVVSTLLVPALTALVGKRAWWPSPAAPQATPRQKDSLRELRPIAQNK
jgi:RND superfamily putative drug exporter